MTQTFGSFVSVRFRLLWLAGALLGAITVQAQSTGQRLLMFDADDCPFCERWRDEVGVVYAKTREGKLAPLQQTALSDALPSGVKLAKPVRYTPTFVLLNADGVETGRITGYLGEYQFWGLLGTLLPPVKAGKS